MEPEDSNEKDRNISKWKIKLLGVLFSFGAASLLLITNSIIAGMKLDFADVMFVQGLGQVIIFPLIIYKKKQLLLDMEWRPKQEY